MHYLNIQVAFCPQTSEIMTKCASGDLGIKSEQFSHTFADKVRIVYFLPPDNERGGGVIHTKCFKDFRRKIIKVVLLFERIFYKYGRQGKTPRKIA